MFRSPIKFEITYDLQNVLKSLDCSENSIAYPIFLEVFDNFEKIKSKISPTAYVVNFNDKLYCLVSIGNFLETYCKKYYDDGKYLEYMILNEIGDQIVFNGTKYLYNFIKTTLDGTAFLSKRFEPGTSNISVSENIAIIDIINNKFNTDIVCNESGMITPLKSVAYFYNLEKSDNHNGDRSCGDCVMKDCKHRKHNLKIFYNNDVINIEAINGSNLMEILRQYNINITAPCNGRGTCGKCQVQLSDKVVLACDYIVNRDEVITIKNDNKSSIEGSYLKDDTLNIKTTNYSLGIDIGTTTIVLSLVDKAGIEISQTRILNPQKAYGSDVISRIEYARSGDKTLTNVIRNALIEEINKILAPHNINKDMLNIVVSANTTMIYLLLDLDVNNLAVAPFVPEKFTFYKYTLGEYEINILPWISGFVGGDILSGIYALPKDNLSNTYLYVDIGTNGEMVLCHNNTLYCCSTAAGPAFEGANISSGVGSISGAISHVKFDKTNCDFLLETIHNKKPIGICGSGLIDLVAILIDENIVDKNGYLENEIYISDNISIMPKDIRQVQLAKASIAAGIDTLLNSCNLTVYDIDTLYVAGGFGTTLNLTNAVKLGLFSSVPLDKIKPIGNMSLGGAIKYAMNFNVNEITKLVNIFKFIELSSDVLFNEAYVNHMFF